MNQYMQRINQMENSFAGKDLGILVGTKLTISQQ